MRAGCSFLCVGLRNPDFTGTAGDIHELGRPCLTPNDAQRVDQGFVGEGRLIAFKPPGDLSEQGWPLTRGNIQRCPEIGYSLVQGTFGGREGGVAHGVVCHEKTFASFG